MLNEIIESARETLTKKQFTEFLDLITTDIRKNRIAYGKWTGIHYVIMVSKSCLAAVGRGNVA